MDNNPSRRLLIKAAAFTVGAPLLSRRIPAKQTSSQLISYGETKNGEIDAEDPVYRQGYRAEPWQINGEVGDEIELGVNVGDLSGIQYWFENPTGTVMYSSSTYGEWSGFAITLPQTGPYTFWVGPYPENHYGTYSLSLAKRGDDHLLSPGDSVTETLTNGDIEWGEFATGSGGSDAAQYLDLYLTPGSAGQTVSVTVQSQDFTPKIAVAPLYTKEYNATVQEGTASSPESEATLTHEFTQEGNIEILVTATEESDTGQYTIAVFEGERDSITANVGPQSPVTISSFPYTETVEVLYDGKSHDGMDIRVTREKQSEATYRVSFRFEKVDGSPIEFIGGYGYSQILVLLSNVNIVNDQIKARVNGGEPVWLVVGDLVYTVASGGIRDLVLHPIKELAKTVIQEVATNKFTSWLNFSVPPDVQSVDDVTLLRIDFSEEPLPTLTSPMTIQQFELEMTVSVAEDSGQPSISIIPDLRGQTIGQPSDNPITGTIAGHLPVEYRRQLLLPFAESTQESADTSNEVVEHHFCSFIEDPGDNAPARCIGRGSTFSTEDRSVYNYIRFANATSDLTVSWEWYTPSGDLYFEYSISNNEGFTGFEAYSYIDVRGEPPASLPGEWLVRTILNGGEREFDQRFTIQ